MLVLNLLLLFYSVLDHNSMSHCHPHPKQVFHPWLISFRNTLSDKTTGVSMVIAYIWLSKLNIIVMLFCFLWLYFLKRILFLLVFEFVDVKEVRRNHWNFSTGKMWVGPVTCKNERAEHSLSEESLQLSPCLSIQGYIFKSIIHMGQKTWRL